MREGGGGGQALVCMVAAGVHSLWLWVWASHVCHASAHVHRQPASECRRACVHGCAPVTNDAEARRACIGAVLASRRAACVAGTAYREACAAVDSPARVAAPAQTCVVLRPMPQQLLNPNLHAHRAL